MNLDRRQRRLFSMNGGGAATEPGRTLAFNFSSGTVVDRMGGVVPTFSRATIKTHTDWEGKPSTALSGEVVLEGLRRVQNLVTSNSEDSSSTFTANGAIADDAADFPAGTSKSGVFTSNGGGATFWRKGTLGSINSTGVCSIWLKGVGAAVGQNITISFNDAGAGATSGPLSFNVPLPAVWTRYSGITPAAFTGATTQFQVSTGLANGLQFKASGWMVEAVTGQSNQNPSAYVSVGILATPFHGAKVDAVKYFPYLNGNSVSAANVVTEANGASIPSRTGIAIASLYGTGAGSGTVNFSAPTFNSPGDLDLRIYDVAKRAFAGVAEEYFVSKWTAVGNQRSFIFGISSGGNLRAYISTNGTDSPAISSTVLVTTLTINGVAISLRMTRTAADGVVTFYYSFDRGVTWIQLGATVVLSAGNMPFNSTALLMLGSIDTGTTNPWTGTFTEAEVMVSIGGARLKHFRSSDWVAGGTLTSSTTGEVYTLNGGAKINKWANGYYPELAGTNLVLQSEDFSTTWTVQGSPTRVAAALKCGNIKLDLIGDDDAAALEYYFQNFLFTADAVKAVSLYFAQGTSTSSVVQIVDTIAAATRIQFTITWTNGIPTVTTTTGTFVGVFPKANGVWRAEVLTTSVTAANNHQIRICPATDAVFAVANVGNIYIGGVQAENSAERCSSYIPTTVGSVPRNSDNMSTPTSGPWFSATTSSLVAWFVRGSGSATPNYQVLASLHDGSVGNAFNIYSNVTTHAAKSDVTSATVGQATMIGAVLADATLGAMGAVMALNDAALITNGVVSATDATVTLPIGINLLEIGEQLTASYFNGLICSLDYYAIRKQNADLQRLTT